MMNHHSTQDPPSDPSLPRSSTAPHHRHHISKSSRHRHGASARNTISSTLPQLTSPFNFDSYNPLKRSHPHPTPSDDASHSSPTATAGTSTQQSSSSSKTTAPRPEPPVLHPPASRLPSSHLAATQSAVTTHQALRSDREAALRSALQTLSRKAHSETRRLDDTYYSLLERLGTLKSSVAALRHLHSRVEASREAFERDSTALERKGEHALRHFGGFEEQEGAVAGLVGRVEKGRARAKELERRLEGCRGRLEGWERREREGRRVRRWRYGIAGTVTGIVVLLIVVFLVWRGVKATDDGRGGIGMSNWGFGERRNKSGIGIHLQVDEKGRKKAEEQWKHVLDEL